MNNWSPYRFFAAFGLLLVLVLPLGMQGLHPWLDRHDEQSHCRSDRGQVHLHDQSYAFEHCFVCTFHFSHYTEQPSPTLAHEPGWMVNDLPIEGDQVRVTKIISARSSRAPPAVV